MACVVEKVDAVGDKVAEGLAADVVGCADERASYLRVEGCVGFRLEHCQVLVEVVMMS